MQAVWEVLENFYAGVYVADMNTHELVYMNAKAREWFQLSSPEEYKGKKCYALLQNATIPCPFCTNAQLLDDQFYEWDYYNPTLNKTFHLKDYIVPYNGEKYRIEIAIPDDSAAAVKNGELPGINPETFMNRCLMATHSTSTPSVSLELMMQDMGTQLFCDSICLYEQMDDGKYQTTYFWSNSQTEHPQTVSIDLSYPQYIQQLFRNEILIFSDSDIHYPNPSQFSTRMDFSKIHTLVVAPLLSKEKIIGLLWLQNPNFNYVLTVAGTIKVLTHFMGTILVRRDLMTHLEALSYHDQMTQMLNRHALNHYISSDAFKNRKSIGLIYCDLIGLKRINDNLGHSNGDRLIMQAAQILCDLFSSKNVYRLGGDEFLVVCQDISKKQLKAQISRLRDRVAEENCALSIGYTWSDSIDMDFSQLLTSADDSMYRDKLAYYQSHQEHEQHYAPIQSTAFQSFLQNYYFDAETVFHSIAMPETPFYLFCGDVLRNVYYISDNLRDTFNFDSNLVYDFLSLIEQRIYEPDRQLHINSSQTMLREKHTTYSIRYRIYNKDGQLVWMHCRGILLWNADKSKALFCSGSMISLKNESEVDSITGLLNVTCAMSELAVLCHQKTNFLMCCFSLRRFSDINLSFGRGTGDTILREIASRMESELGDQYKFFRLDGVCFLIITEQGCAPRVLANTIHQIVLEVYRNNDIHIMYPCAIGVLHAPHDGVTPQELINNVMIASQNAKKTPSAEFVEFSNPISSGCREQSNINLALNYSVNHGFQDFRIVIQPQVLTTTGQIYGGEVLLRWKFDGQDIPPSKFVPILEQLGLIVPVGKWVVTQIMQFCEEIFVRFPAFRLSFNVSYLQILDPVFFDYIQDAMHLYNVPGKNIMIELTETHFDEMPDYLDRFIHRCEKVGISFVLDDFGTAYSSLQLLLQYPADLIKLDRTLMCELTSAPEKLNFMMSIIYACHRFGKKVCVEGVETEEELNIVRQTECDFIQGYYFYEPLELPEFSRILRNENEALR